MSIQYIIGAAGTGKSFYLNHRTACEAKAHPEQNYIMLVPEQYTSELQREMIAIHEDHGFMNIDIIGFNRLAYRVFEEQNVSVDEVLEDFGKSMLLRRIAGELQNTMAVYKSCIDKHGFIDEVKSLLSELFTYHITETDLEQAMEKLQPDDALYLKLQDVLALYRGFQSRIADSYIVAEQTTELLARYIATSALVKRSIISMDGFTGFTPVQMQLVREILLYAPEVRITVTIDLENYFRTDIREHELYFLSHQTLNRLNQVVEENGIPKEQPVLLERQEEQGRFRETPCIRHLEQHIFRYPVVEYQGEQPEDSDIQIWECRNRREELSCIAEYIRENVKAGMRYSDMAVITGDLEHMAEYAGKLLEDYEIPYFLDYNREMRNNPYMDALCQLVEIIDKNYDYDSVFAFLKSGIVSELTEDITERLENYSLAKGLRGYSKWSRPILDEGLEEVEEARKRFLEITEPVYRSLKNKEARVSDYVNSLQAFAEAMDYEHRIEEQAERLTEAECYGEASAYKRLYEKLNQLFQKFMTIMPEEKLPLHEFLEILRLGMSEIEMGIIPPTQDKVVVGDLNRTRLGNVKILFLANVNDGIIPGKGNPARIMNDRDRDRLNQLGLELAPTSRQNTFIEQFYLYTMMTKPTQKLVLSYSLAGGDNAAMTPSYLIGRVLRMFPKLGVQKRTIRPFYGTIQTDLFFLTKGLRQLLEQSGEDFRQEEFYQTALLYRIFAAGDREQELELIRRGMQFDNGANPLSQEARDAVKERLLAQSVSKLEKYAGCAYAYFLQYGLRLKERERYEIDTRNIGNILHYALRETFTEVKQQYANDWSSLSEQQLCGIMRQQVEAACSREKEGLLSEKGRMQFVIQNLQSIGERTIRTLRYQIVSGKMKPVYFEKAFSGMSGIQQAKLQVKGMEVPLSGIIDRGDLKVEDENVYVKLVDYKSGNRDFQLEYFYEGLQLQLVVYMNVLLEIVARDYPNKQVIPAGMYYYHMDDPYLEQETEDEEAAEDAIRKTLRCHGVPNLDGDILEMQEQDILEKDSGRVLPLDIKKGELVPESYGADTAQFQRLCSFGKHKMEQLAEQLLDGNISKAPALKNETLTCAYCAYRSVCRFDSSYSGNRIRKLKYSAREKREIWQSMTEADKEGGSEDGGME